MSSFVHASAVVEPGARIGANTKVWHFCHVCGGAEIGPDCTLGQNVYVGEGVKLGRGVKVQNNVSLYSGVELEDYVFCGPSMVFTNVKLPRAAFPRSPAEYVRTRVCHGASIGANATVICGVTIGKWAFVGAGAVVTRDVRDHARVLGVPARAAGWVCQCGETLGLSVAAGRASAACKACGLHYLAGSSGLELVAGQGSAP